MTGCRCPSELEEVHYLIADKEEDIKSNHKSSVYPREYRRSKFSP